MSNAGGVPWRGAVSGRTGGVVRRVARTAEREQGSGGCRAAVVTASAAGAVATRADGADDASGGPRTLGPCALFVGGAASSPFSATATLSSTERPE
jgi:hypothetical protein